VVQVDSVQSEAAIGKLARFAVRYAIPRTTDDDDAIDQLSDSARLSERSSRGR
jgi:hypothetical protein